MGKRKQKDKEGPHEKRNIEFNVENDIVNCNSRQLMINF